MNILDHSDHKKTCRALILFSSAYILLQQCAFPLDETTVLGLKVYLTKGDLSQWLFYAVCVFLVIFLLRYSGSGALSARFHFREKRNEERDRDLTLRGHAQGWGKFDRLNGEAQSLWFRGLSSLPQKPSTEIKRLKAKQVRLVAQVGRLYDFWVWMDVGLLYLTEFFPPVLFAGAALYVAHGNTIGLVCPSSPVF